MTASPVSLLVPLYIYPSPLTAWNTVNAGAPVIRYLIANPASGPGTMADSNYTTAITAAQAAGITVLGYTDTDYTAVSESTVSANIARWKSLYGVTSIFFDEVSSGSGQLGYYSTVCGYVHATPGAVTVLNHGTIPDPGYAAIGDILCVFEGTQASWSSFTASSWFSSYPPPKFCALVYSTATSGAMTTVMTQARGAGIGNVYITDEADDNFSALPTYLPAELAAAAAPQSGYAPSVPGAMWPGSAWPGEPLDAALSLFAYGGTETLTYIAYIDVTAGHTLLAVPGGTYAMQPAGLGFDYRLPSVPEDGLWTAVEG